MQTPDLGEILDGLAQGHVRSVARAISVAERGGAERDELVRRLYPQTGEAQVVGVTGSPGAGKSTLVNRMAHLFRRRGERVGILAVDPSSPFSGGALLGDRIRMQDLYTDSGVFIRSMATRGALGGLASATHDAVDVLDAAGYDRILLETVGVGQDEVDVVRSVDTVLVVMVPGMGDDIQAIKAGLMEIADVFVINKSDRDGADRTNRDIDFLLSLSEHEGWMPPVVRTVASRDEGVEALLEKVAAHRQWLESSGELAERRKAHLRLRIEAILQQRILAAADRTVGLGRAVTEAFAERIDPYAAAARLYTGVIERAIEDGVGSLRQTGNQTEDA